MREGDYFTFAFGLDAVPEVGQGVGGQAEQGQVILVQFYCFFCVEQRNREADGRARGILMRR